MSLAQEYKYTPKELAAMRDGAAPGEINEQILPLLKKYQLTRIDLYAAIEIAEMYSALSFLSRWTMRAQHKHWLKRVEELTARKVDLEHQLGAIPLYSTFYIYGVVSDVPPGDSQGENSDQRGSSPDDSPGAATPVAEAPTE